MVKKNGIFFPFPYFSPRDHAVFGSPSQTVTVLRCVKMMIFTLGLNVHSSACKFNDFVMNYPDNCSFKHFFFSSILLPIALLSLAIVGFTKYVHIKSTTVCREGLILLPYNELAVAQGPKIYQKNEL